jgi:hypothetical protein
MNDTPSLDHGLFEHDYRKMIEVAIRLYALSAAAYPLAWKTIAAPQVLADATVLAVYCRRVIYGLNLLGNKKTRELPIRAIETGNTDECSDKIQMGGKTYVELRQLDHCLNHLMHMEKVEVLWVPINKEEKLFSPKALGVRTDNFPKQNDGDLSYVPIMRLCVTILTDLSEIVKKVAPWATYDWSGLSVEQVGAISVFMTGIETGR